MVEACVDYRFCRVEMRSLHEKAHLYVTTEYHTSAVTPLRPGNDREESGLSSAVFGNETHLLSLRHAEAYILEKQEGAKRLCQVTHFKHRSFLGHCQSWPSFSSLFIFSMYSSSSSRPCLFSLDVTMYGGSSSHVSRSFRLYSSTLVFTFP